MLAVYKDYLDTISRPMCINQVRTNLYSGVYTNVNQFAKDMRQIWTNAKAYNPPSHQVTPIFLDEIFSSVDGVPRFFI